MEVQGEMFDGVGYHKGSVWEQASVSLSPGCVFGYIQYYFHKLSTSEAPGRIYLCTLANRPAQNIWPRGCIFSI